LKSGDPSLNLDLLLASPIDWFASILVISLFSCSIVFELKN
jgi:hypothetical protein